MAAIDPTSSFREGARPWRARLEALGGSLAVRALVASVFLAGHLFAMTSFARERFGLPFNSVPTAAPGFVAPAMEPSPSNWSRLIVSRWDSQHYIAIALRGYTTCKPRGTLAAGEFPDDTITCQLNFYPGYPWIGRYAAMLTKLPIDYAMLGVSLASSFAFLVMWTSRPMRQALGTTNAYLSLLLLNVFTTGFALVTIQTEPCVLAFTLGAFILFTRRSFVLGAIVAGAATAMRISGVAAGLAFALALLVFTIQERPPRVSTWIGRGLLMVLAGWGVIALMSYYAWRFNDPLIYSHSHGRAYHHAPDPLAIFFPDARIIAKAVCAAPNEGVFLAGGLLWFALGHRAGLGGFATPERVFWYALFVVTVGISAVGSVDLGYGGMTRYLLLALPLFFAMAAAMRGRPVVLSLWIAFSLLHYWSVDLCFYVGRGSPNWVERCNFVDVQ